MESVRVCEGDGMEEVLNCGYTEHWTYVAHNIIMHVEVN